MNTCHGGTIRRWQWNYSIHAIRNTVHAYSIGKYHACADDTVSYLHRFDMQSPQNLGIRFAQSTQ